MKNNKSITVQVNIFLAIIIAIVVTGIKKSVTKAIAALVITIGLYCGCAIHWLKDWLNKKSLVDKLKLFFDKPLVFFVGIMISFIISNILPNFSELGTAMLKLISKDILIAITVIIMLCDRKLRAIAKEHKRLFSIDFLIFMLTSKIYSLVFIKGFYSDLVYVEIPGMWIYAQAIGIFTAVLWVGVSFGFAYLLTDGKILDTLKDRYSEKIESVKNILRFVWWKLCRFFGIRTKKKNVQA